MKYALASISVAKALRGNVDLDGEVESLDHRVDAGAQAATRERGRQDPVGQLAQLLVAVPHLFEPLREERPQLWIVGSKRTLGELQRHDGMDEPLLRSVVQIAHDAAPRFVRLAEKAHSRGGQLIPAVGIRDRGVQQLGELRDPRFGVGGWRVRAAPVRDDHAPRPAFHDDGRLHGGAHPELLRDVGAPAHLPAGQKLARCRPTVGHLRDLVAVHVAAQDDSVSAEQRRGLGSDRVEDGGRRRALGDEGRDPSQRRLLVGEAAKVVVDLRLRYCGGDQLGERRQALLDLLRRRGGQHEAAREHAGVGGQRRARRP